jgi:hypothetical protein
MTRLRRAWAVLRGTDADAALIASLRASLDDARADAKRYAAERAGLERVLRTILEEADHGLANPTENGR